MVLITGASSGIGRATAFAMGRRGARVALIARNQDRLASLVAELGDLGVDAHAYFADVTDAMAVRSAVALAAARFQRIDVLVNNAGLGQWGGLGDSPWADLEYVFSVNVFGALHAIRAVLPYMRRQKSGFIVNVSSAVGKLAVANMGAYSASKFALGALSDALRIEEGPRGIGVCTLYPGATATEFVPNVRGKRPGAMGQVRGVSPERAAERIVRAVVRRERDAWVTVGDRLGTAVARLFPRLTDWGMARFVERLERQEER